MKLSSEDIKNLMYILQTCDTANIQSVIIEEGKVRGANEAKDAILISDVGIPAFPQKIALARLPQLRSRISLFPDNLSIEAKESDRGEIVSLELSAGKLKAQFRCLPTMLIKAPKFINDTDNVLIKLNIQEIKTMLQSAKTMGAKIISLFVRNSEVSYSVADEAKDILTSSFETPAVYLGDDTSSVYFDYATDIFSSILKNADSNDDVVELYLGESGTLRCKTLLGHDITMLAKITDSEDD